MKHLISFAVGGSSKFLTSKFVNQVLVHINGFQSFTVEQPRVIDYDFISKTYNRVPVNRHGNFVHYYLPWNLKDNFVLEKKPLSFPISRLELKKNVVVDFDLPFTPQLMLDAGVYYVEKEKAPLASYCAWMCGNLQMNWFLLSHGIDADCSLFKNKILSFICNKENLHRFESFDFQLLFRWGILEQAYADVPICGDLIELDSILNTSLRSAEIFSNLIYDYNQKNVFKRKDLIDWILKEESRYEDMMKLKILHEGVWKEFQYVYNIYDVESIKNNI